MIQGVTKRFRLACLTNSALVNEPKCGGSGGVAGPQINKLWKSNSIFNLWPDLSESVNFFTKGGNGIVGVTSTKRWYDRAESFDKRWAG